MFDPAYVLLSVAPSVLAASLPFLDLFFTEPGGTEAVAPLLLPALAVLQRLQRGTPIVVFGVGVEGNVHLGIVVGSKPAVDPGAVRDGASATLADRLWLRGRRRADEIF